MLQNWYILVSWRIIKRNLSIPYGYIRDENLQIIIWFQIFFPTPRTIPEISVNLQRFFLGEGGGRVPLESASGWSYGAWDFQSVKVFGLCFTLIGWLFSPMMWKIVWLPGASRAGIARVTALRTFQIFFAKVCFHPCWRTHSLWSISVAFDPPRF